MTPRRKAQGKFWIQKAVMIFLLVFLVFSLSGCEIQKSEWAGNRTYTTSFDSLTGVTTITWSGTLDNSQSIYDITSFVITYDLYFDGEYLGSTSDTYGSMTYDTHVKHGQLDIGSYKFTIEQEVDQIVFVSWVPEYASFWETYQGWLLGVIVLLVLALIVSPIVIFVYDLEITDLFDTISEFVWLPLIFIPVIIGSGGFTGEWVIVMLIIGALIAVFLICLITFGIKALIEGFLDFELIPSVWFLLGAFLVGGIAYGFIVTVWWPVVVAGSLMIVYALTLYLIETIIDGQDDDEAEEDDEAEDWDDFSDWTVTDLKDECRRRGLSGYSTMRKQELFDLLENSQDEDSQEIMERDLRPLASASKRQKRDHHNTQGKRITFDDIVGLEDAKEAVKEKIVYPVTHSALYEKYGKKAGGGILLYGLPGTGKTMFAEAVASEIHADFYPIKCSDIKSKWYGESEQKVRKLFENARRSEKSVIFFDEFEAIGRKRTDGDDSGNNDLVPEILSQMQGIHKDRGNALLLVIAATNRPWDIDSALLRPGRFEEKIRIPLPDYEARHKLFELRLSNIPKEDDVSFDELAVMTEGFNGSDINEYCEKLKMEIIKRAIETHLDTRITKADINFVRQKMKTSVQQEDIDRLVQFESDNK